MITAIDADVIVQGVASQVCPSNRCSPVASTSDVAGALSPAYPRFVTWTLRFPAGEGTLQHLARLSFEAQVVAHGYERLDAKTLGADLVEAFLASPGLVFGGVEVKSARCRQFPTEIRFDGQSTTHNRYITTFAVTAAT